MRSLLYFFEFSEKLTLDPLYQFLLIEYVGIPQIGRMEDGMTDDDDIKCLDPEGYLGNKKYKYIINVRNQKRKESESDQFQTLQRMKMCSKG